MKIILSSDNTNGVDDVQGWLDYNRIEYYYRTFWDSENCRYSLPADIDNSVVVLCHDYLQNVEAAKLCRKQQITNIKEFCRRGNQLWILGTDIGVKYATSSMSHFVQAVDADIVKGSIVFFLDAAPTDRCYLNHLENIKICVLSATLFNRRVLRCQSSTLVKKICQHDYLLTMIKKRRRPHRHVLWQELQRRPGLIDQGLVVVHHGRPLAETWQGKSSHQHDWQDGHASMDLYSDCWLEIVPETCYRDLYFFTEKTHKPMMTCTPFLMVSTAGYLAWLQQQGFRTFHSLIDEGYDQHHCVEDRVRHMVDVLEDIIRNGAESFYQASQDILDHNFSRLSEIAGSWHWRFDQVLWQALEDFDIFGNNPVRS